MNEMMAKEVRYIEEKAEGGREIKNISFRKGKRRKECQRGGKRKRRRGMKKKKKREKKKKKIGEERKHTELNLDINERALIAYLAFMLQCEGENLL